MNKKLFRIIMLVTVLLTVLPVFSASSTEVETLLVDADGENVLAVYLNRGDKIKGSFSVSGGIDDAVYFRVTDPYGNIVVDLGYVSQGTAFEVSAQEVGAYTLVFENNSRRNAKHVTVSYNVEAGILSNPFLWVGVVILFAILAAIATYVLAKRRKSKQISDI